MLTGVRYWLLVAVAAFFLNLGWETAHGALYAHAIPGWRYLQAAGGDLLLIAIGVSVAALLRDRSRYVYRTAVVMVLTAIAVSVELHALATGRWSYTATMPTVGPVGLSPLLQLPLTALASLWVARRVAIVDPQTD